MGEPLGNSRWSDDTGSSRAEALNGRQFFFGELYGGNLYTVAPKGHLLTIAPTRAGKGTCLIVNNLLHYSGSALVIDPKGENAWLTGLRRHALGQKIHILDPWDEVYRWYGAKVGATVTTSRFNPLSVLKPGDDDFLDNLAYLADALIITQSTKENPYFDDSARELWAGLMAFVVESPAYSDIACLGLVRSLLMRQPEELKRTIQTAIEMSGSMAARKLGQFGGDWGDKSTGMAGVIATARIQTAFLDNDVLNRSMEASDFSFDDLREGGTPTTVFLVLPPDKLGTYGRWLRLIVSIAIGAVQKGPLEKGGEAEEVAVQEVEAESEPEWEPELEPEPEPEPVAEKEDAAAPEPFGLLKLPGAPPGWDEMIGKGIPVLPPSPLPKESPLSWLREIVSAFLPRAQHRPAPLTLADLARIDAEREAKRKHAEAERQRAELERRIAEAEKKRLMDETKKRVMDERLKQKERLRLEKLKWFGLYTNQASAEKGAKIAAVGLPTLFLLDEFGTIGKLAAVSKAFGLMAGLGMSMWVFVQDLNQLKRDYPDEWGTFVSNASAVSCFGVMDQFTAEEISKMLGMRTVRHKTTSSSRSRTTGRSVSKSENTKVDDKYMPGFVDAVFFNAPLTKEDIGGHSTSDSESNSDSSSENTNEQVVAQPLMATDDLRRAGVRVCFVIGRGYPVFCTLIPYFEDAEFRRLARPDPRYQKASP
jgi:type IV secretory pathway TraG/TraD family ATPase VirD4